MLFLVLIAFPVVFAFCKRFAFGAFFVSAGVFGMAGHAAGGELPTIPESSTSLRLITLDETVQKRAVVTRLALTAAGYRAKSISILEHWNDLAELREHIKYELRRGNITADKAASLSALIDELNRDGNVTNLHIAAQRQARQQALYELAQSQVRLNETLADTTKLVTVLDSLRSPEFAGTFIAAKIQVVRLLAEKAAVDGSIDEIRQSMKRPQAG